MKIAFLSAAYFPESGGTAIRVDGLAYGLHQLGHSVVVLVPGNEFRREKWKNCIVYRIPYKKRFIVEGIEKFFKFNIARFKAYYKYIFDIIQQEKIQCIHCRQPFEFYYLGLLAQKKLKLPLIFECHRFLSSTEYQLGNYPFFFYKIIHFIEKKLLNKSDAIVAITDTGLRTLRKEGVTKKIVVIPNATNIVMNNHSRIKVNLKNNDKVFLYAGTLRETEGLETLLKAFSIVCKKYDHIKLLIIGEGGEKEKLKELAKQLEIDKQVIFIDQVAYSEIAAYYKRALAFVHPRRGIPYHESFIGLKIYDALATELPIITSEVGELGEMIKKQGIGLITKADDHRDFAKAVVRILENKKLYKAIKNNLLRVSKKSSWIKSGKELEKLYRSLV